MSSIDRKGLIIGTVLGLMLGATVVSGYNELKFMFSCSVIVNEKVDVEIVGLTPTKGFYSITFNELTGNITKSIMIRNNGNSDVILTWASIDLPQKLELKIVAFENNSVWSPIIPEWKENTKYILPGNATINLYIILSTNGADLGVYNFYIDFHGTNDL